MEKITLQESTHIHELKASKIIILDESPIHKHIQTEGKGFIFHDEHGSIVTESSNLAQYIQQEYNPISKKFENAYD